MPNLYDDLGLDADKDRGVDEPGLRKAFRKRAKAVHPDNRETGDAGAFKRASVALAILSDPLKKERYDRTGTFDEAAPDNLTATAVECLAGCLETVLDNEAIDVETTDLAGLVRSIIDAMAANAAHNIEPLKRQLRRREKAAIRFTKKKKRGGFVGELLAQQSARLQAKIDELELLHRAFDRARELLDETSYCADAPRPAAAASNLPPGFRFFR